MMMNLEAEAGRLLKQRGQSVACAESCTGGLVTSRLTDVAGSSAYVHGSVVCYTNDIKQRVVGVKARTLTAHTAISAQTAQEMAESIRKLMDTDYGISTTGNAGPANSEGKPVGLIYTAVAGPHGTEVQAHRFTGTRSGIKQKTADIVLKMLISALRRED
ncbi:MAG: CinA family protein [Selenomonas sp.]|jgi:nicotinamide-nucleotide amidase|nr:CinA family protein [Selenomonas sp.]MCI7330451.1 CinA family protein [Selenomonadaceae bacterium]MDD6120438.1 CinA family protein [Selenomonadaceae bacterium]MDD7056047.1 CinA family protein [Selenomonadaceae bacterium]MDY3916241.1 CinA family protein [Selenomonadaceae bacterium]